jgi:RNA polymerase sigma factor (TIGR02999 family)
MSKPSGNVTELLSQVGAGDADKVAKELMPLVYEELHSLADRFLKGERKGHTLQPTALVHEAYLRLVDQSRVNWQGKTHFFAVGAAMMRRVLIDYARTRGRVKRGGDWQRLQLQDDLLGHSAGEVRLVDMSDALDELAAVDPQQAGIVELRFFGGLTVEEIAQMQGVSKRKIEGEWTHAKAWLKNRLSGMAER